MFAFGSPQSSQEMCVDTGDQVVGWEMGKDGCPAQGVAERAVPRSGTEFMGCSQNCGRKTMKHAPSHS